MEIPTETAALALYSWHSSRPQDTLMGMTVYIATHSFRSDFADDASALIRED
jgi:hypothetical protein